MTPRPAQPTPGSGPPELGALDALVADLEHVLELEVLDRTGFGGEAQHRVLHLGVEDETGGIRFGIAADDQDFLPEIDERRERVLRRRRLADAAFSVECDLAKFAHGPCSFDEVSRTARLTFQAAELAASRSFDFKDRAKLALATNAQ